MAYDDLAEHCVELLSAVGPARARRMFGGQGLYLGDRFVGIVAYNKLYLKTSEATRQRFVEAGGEPFVYDTKQGQQTSASYWTPPAEALESPALMEPWARLALAATLAAAGTRKRVTRTTKPARGPRSKSL